jgi:hypothetical protein
LVQPALELVIASPLLDGFPAADFFLAELTLDPWERPAEEEAMPARALMRVDFPTLERPRRQISGQRRLRGRLRKRGAE